LLSGVPKAIIGVVIGVVLWWGISGKKFFPTEEEKIKTKRKLKYASGIAIVLAITAFVQMITLAFINEVHPFTEGKTFYQYEEFIEYMEQEVEEDDFMMGEPLDGIWIENVEEYEVHHYYDENGNSITREEYERLYRTETVYDKHGNALFTYINRNESVHAIKYGWGALDEGEDMPITVYTYQDLRHENVVIDDLINPVFGIVYVVEIIVGIVLYFKRKKMV